MEEQKKKNNKTDENAIFKRLKEGLALKEQEALLGRYFRKPVWWLVQKVDKNLSSAIKDMNRQCAESAGNERESQSCVNNLCGVFEKAKRSKRAEFFRCHRRLWGFCYPIVQGKKIYGYIAVCHAEREIPQIYIDIFSKYIDTLVREIQKEQQLAKLYETIRPRAIALSTVHTIHRLLTSTLDLDELLPRIARLSLQIVRANRCSIKLVDKAKKVLLPKTTVDLRKKKVKLKKVKIGMYAPGKAFKKAKVIRGGDYMAIPLIDQDVIGVITVYDKIDGSFFNHFDQEIMTTLAEQAVIAINNALLYKEQEKITEGTIKSLAALLERGTPGRLTPRAPFLKILLETARYLKLSPQYLKSLEYAYLLHDVGKAVLPASLLTKPSKLTGREYRLIKEHPERGAAILRPLKTLRESVPMILHQRERYDGKGYPDRLKAEKIPFGARIIAVVSAFEAMIVRRPYHHQKKSVSKAVEEIRRNSGTQFDPKMVEAFLRIMNRPHIKKMLRREGYAN